jgi:hypothetical protein
MPKRFNPIHVRLLVDDQSPLDSDLRRESCYLKAAFPLNAARVVGPLTPEERKHESLGRIWPDIEPSDGRYTFEIATELAYYLPNVGPQPEYSLEVRGNRFLVCNRMLRAFCGKGQPEEDGLAYFLAHRMGLPSVLEEAKCSGLHPVPLRTFVSRKFFCTAQCAEEAIDENFMPWREEFVADVALLVEAVRAVASDEMKHSLPHAAMSWFPVFWVAVEGDKGKMACEQFTGDLERVALMSMGTIATESIDELRPLLRGERPIAAHEQALSLALTFWHHGYYDLAVVQLCTACETVLSSALLKHLKVRGASETHLKKYFDDLTYSHLLNLHLPSMRDLATLNDWQEILGQVNWARKMRNEIVHHGTAAVTLTRASVKDAIDCATQLVAFVVSKPMRRP